jgi:hypothetical protein
LSTTPGPAGDGVLIGSGCFETRRIGSVTAALVSRLSWLGNDHAELVIFPGLVCAGNHGSSAAETFEQAREAATHIPDKAVNAAQRATRQFGRAVADEGMRDQLLLGTAGLAVAAALGIAYQRRTHDERAAWN